MSYHILFVPIDSYGHVNACVGIGEKLVSLGHKVTFAIERSWTGKIAELGFGEEIYVAPDRENATEPNEYWIQSMKLIEDTLPRDSLYKVGHQNIQEFEEFIFNELKFDDQLVQIINKLSPDVIVVDNYFSVPAVYNSGRKWVQMTSANPLSAITHPDTPPSGSGYPTDGDRAQWKLFEDTFTGHYGPTMELFAKRLKEFGLPDLPENSLFHPSPYLNIYAYPLELDYLDIRPLPDKWKRFDHFIRSRKQQENFELPDKLKNLSGKLIYVSMGSMGCADKNLMTRLNQMLAQIAHRFVMVLGPDQDPSELADNIWGGRMLPQVAILSQVDLMITHGGNNSVLECLYSGKPMIINPLFADQYDNAQRVTEKKYGYRINLYTCSVKELGQMIESVLNDTAMLERCQLASKRLRESNSTEKVAKAIIEIASGN